MAPAGGALRAALRFVAAVSMVSGSLLVVDATATLVWQEPVSWAIAESGQSDLERRLATIPARPQESSAVAARRLAARARPGDPVGRIGCQRSSARS